MRKVGNILLLVSGILTILGAIGVLVGSIVMFVISSPAYTQMIIDGLKSGEIHSDIPGTPEEVAAQVQRIMFIMAIVLLVVFAFEVGCSVVALLAHKKETSGLYIATIVTGVFCGGILAIVGGILGIADSTPAPAK